MKFFLSFVSILLCCYYILSQFSSFWFFASLQIVCLLPWSPSSLLLFPLLSFAVLIHLSMWKLHRNSLKCIPQQSVFISFTPCVFPSSFPTSSGCPLLLFSYRPQFIMLIDFSSSRNLIRPCSTHIFFSLSMLEFCLTVRDLHDQIPMGSNGH